MNWFKENNEQDLISKIKRILKKHPFTIQLMNDYSIPIADIDDNLEINVVDLEDIFAEGNGKKININKKLINDDFLKNNFHFIIHEFFHWIKRRFENKFYFNDPEEIQGFILSITWELLNGKSKREITAKIYPIIKDHFKDEKQSFLIFSRMLNKSYDLLDIYKEKWLI